VATAILPCSVCTFAIYTCPLEAFTHADHRRAFAGVLLPATRDDIPHMIRRLQKTAFLVRWTSRPRPLQDGEERLPYSFAFERRSPRVKLVRAR
jgi:hypothetical protein